MPQWNDIAQITAHRPWPLPDRPWIMTMSWVELLAAHWPIDPQELAPGLPDGLSLDTWNGTAWLSIVPFAMANVMPRGLSWWPRPMYFPELNLRTYVSAEGDKPGVWFYNLEAASRLAVWGARRFFHLPYYHADMTLDVRDHRVSYESVRTHRGATPAEFRATYEPSGDAIDTDPGSFESWIMERYCLYAADGNRLYRSDVQHKPWPLQPATVDIATNTLFEAIGLDLDDEPHSAHYASQIHVLGWGLTPVEP